MLNQGKIRVTNIQRLCVNDGPGVRTVIFLKGCYLCCPWCCNPESINYDSDYFFVKRKCLSDSNQKFCRQCEILAGNRNKQSCPIGVYEHTFRDYTEEELYYQIIRDKLIYESGGGVTFSGGEPLFQAASIKPLVQKLKSENIHVAVETSLYAPHDNLKELNPLIDYWLIDLKFQYGFITNSQYKIVNQFDNNLKSVMSVASSDKILFRMVLMNEALEHSVRIIENLKKYKISVIELLMYHSLAENKYRQLGISFKRFSSPEANGVSSFLSLLRDEGITASYAKI